MEVGINAMLKTRKKYAFHNAGTGITLVQFLVMKEHLVQKHYNDGIVV